MQKQLLASTLTLSALAIATLPAQAQFVSIPVTNGNFAITNNAGTLNYATLPTFLSPAGTLAITTATLGTAGYNSLTPVTVNTPTGFVDINTYGGSVILNDGRTGNFTGGGATLRGTATVTGGTLPATDGITFALSASNLPTGATFTYTVQSGAVHIPQSSLGAYPTPQFTIPVSGGNFTLTDRPGTANHTVVMNSVLTPLGTANLTVNLPNLGGSGLGPNLANPFAVVSYLGPSQPVTLSGLANGTVALSDGRTATVSDRLITLTANTQVASVPAGNYFPGGTLLTGTVFILGTITGGAISIPNTAVSSPPTSTQLPTQSPAQSPGQSPGQPVGQRSIPAAIQNQEVSLGFATGLNLGGDPEDYLQRVEVAIPPVVPDDLPEVEQSSLAFSRIHPGCNSYTR